MKVGTCPKCGGYAKFEPGEATYSGWLDCTRCGSVTVTTSLLRRARRRWTRVRIAKRPKWYADGVERAKTDPWWATAVSAWRTDRRDLFTTTLDALNAAWDEALAEFGVHDFKLS